MAEDRIRAVTAAFGIEPGAEAMRDVARWLDAVARWNRKIDLTAARDSDELADLMLADAALLATHVESGRTLVDVGSGAGAPGMALALLRSDLEVTLVEPMQKRAAFLRTTLGLLGRTSPKVLQRRGEEIEQRFDVAVSRATLAPAEWLALGARLAARGEVWVLLARESAPVLAGWRLAQEHAYRWPLTGAERRAARYVPLPPSPIAER